MTINGINGTNTQTAQMGMNQATDSYSRNIQSQIANAQKQLQELSSNGDIPQEEKMKRRQEIQQQSSDLNMQLRQHQMEQRRAAMNSAEQQAKGSAMDDMGGGANAKAGNKSAGLSQASMTAMISADSSIKHTQKKEGELAEVEQKAQAASSSQLSALADAGRTLEEAAKADSREERDDKDTKTIHKKDADEHVSDTDANERGAFQGEGANAQADVSVSDGAAAAESTPQRSTPYRPVDIRL